MSGPHDVILAIDAGTSGTRAATVSVEGEVGCLHYEPLTVEAPRPGVVEQDADVLLDRTLAACRETIRRALDEGQRIVALALATQRATSVLWDRGTGRALAPAMVWQDTRYAAELDQLGARWDERLMAEAGRPTGGRSPYYWAVRQIRESNAVAGAFARGRLGFGTVDTWLLWQLTAGRTYATTPTNATSGGAYALAEHRYCTDWLEALAFPTDLLPALRQDADDLGRTDPALLGIDVPILASLGDQHAGAIGLGCLHRGQAMCIHGTGSFVDLITGPDRPIRPGLHRGTTAMCARRKDGTTHYAIESFVPTTGSALAWLCDRLGWFEDVAALCRAASEATDTGGVTFLPTLTGMRVPAMQPLARASLSGLSMATSRAQVARAVLEGIAHSVATCVEADEAVAGVAVDELIVGGGLSGSDDLLQMQADLAGVPIRRKRDTARASLRGAAFLAGSSGLLWDGIPVPEPAEGGDEVFVPRLDRQAREARRRLWHARVGAELNHADLLGQMEPSAT